MTLMVLTQATLSADTADPFATTIPSCEHEQVLSFERVSMLAAHLACIHSCRADSAKRVLPFGYCFKMIGVHASTVSAHMIKVLAWLKWSDKRDVRQSVSPAVLPFEPVVPIATLDCGCPVPTSARDLVDLTPEPISKIHNRLPFYRVAE